ncbi:hypothetical protein D3C81_1835490 [compost metagenome]
MGHLISHIQPPAVNMITFRPKDSRTYQILPSRRIAGVPFGHLLRISKRPVIQMLSEIIAFFGSERSVRYNRFVRVQDIEIIIIRRAAAVLQYILPERVLITAMIEYRI